MLAKTCLLMGKRQEALHLLGEALDRHEANALWCITEPDFRALKDDPEYQALVKRVGFPAPTDA